MSKFVKNLITDHLRGRLQGVQDALLVNVVGMDANTNHRLRGALAEKNIHLVVVNNSLANRALADTPLDGLFTGVAGCAAICWGSEDIVSLAKEITKLIGSDKYKPLEARGGVMDGERLTGAQVAEVSKWPNRGEQLSLLLGQILSPGANLVSQLTAVGGALASQIEQKGSADEAPAEAPAEAAAESPAGAAEGAAPAAPSA
jgi:large subunit ribosomal protein L10